jgi:alkylation response protein AidB-like acyl-CoA dehydrogenase
VTTPNPNDFERAARAWLQSAVGPALPDNRAEDFAIFRDLTDEQEDQLLRTIRAYRRARFDAGFGALTLPIDRGGAGLPASYAVRFSQIEGEYDVPASTELISVTAALVAPAVAIFGSVSQRATFLKPLLRTDMLACQLFSEPAAGSDLAGLRCRAVTDADGWLVNGQKIWTSGARHADLGLLLARTDPDQPKHRGITAFLLPLDSAGVTIRPIRQMSGASSFNEVFLDNVSIADTLRIGAVGQGWEVAKVTLAYERQASGAGNRRKGASFSDLLALATDTGAIADRVVCHRLADIYVLSQLRNATVARAARAAAAGVSPGPAGSVGKLVSSELLVSIGELAAEILGDSIIADQRDGTFAWTAHLLGAPGYRLAGGTDQIQRNIIAERVLDLPPEPRVDAGLSFSQLPGM